MSFLSVRNLSKSFGGLIVIQNLSFELGEGEILGVIGPNGSGKTTLFNLITGFLSADGGEVQFCGENVTSRRPSTVCKSGITRTFQIVKPFLRLTALENVMAGRAYGREPARNMKEATKEAEEILAFTGISRKQHIAAQHLNLIDRKRLEIARALATKPKLLLLDEVFAGLNHTEIEQALSLVSRIKELGITMMIVEHVIRVILGVSSKVIVLSSGQKIFEGSPHDAVADKGVIEAYLGEDFHA
ncbi:MAG TPA: ABC transporter ATP-binding protein [Syntrophorhabdales bacterium]|nr:ABC transporter ATP-binding protein [Syntrophorhabdales bacterium]